MYQKTSLQTQNRLQEIFKIFNFAFDNLYNMADKKTKQQVNTYIEEWKDKKLLNGYFGMLADNIYKRTRVKNSEILELLIYSAYIEEQNKLQEKELNIFRDDANYYYQRGQEEVNNTLARNKRKEVSVIPDAIFLALIDTPNSTGLNWQQYIETIMQYNSQQIYKQAILNIQQQKELEIQSNEFQRIIQQQNNQRLNINGNKISGAVDMQMIGLNNLAKVEGIRRLDKNARVQFVSDQCEHVTMMCSNMDKMIFNVNDWNEFDRWYGETAKELKIERIKVFGLVLRN